ncbi:MAG: mechanosensitive ion channel [Limnobacter sp.]|nr:mechanosensitive ion channel [Limnobacter sp.]
MSIFQPLYDLQPLAEKTLNFLDGGLGRLLLSALVIFLGIAINRIIRWRLLAKENLSPEHTEMRAKLVRRRNAVGVSVVLLILALWSSKITGFLISLAAIGGALLIVSKELILCLWGAVIISLNKPLKIGSVVEIGPYTGQLVNTGFLTFDLMEIGPSRKQTGRLLQVPNALLFSEPLKNLSTYGLYGMHLIDFHFEKNVNLNEVEKLVLRLANDAGNAWITKAHNHFQNIEKDSFVDLPKAYPEVYWASVNEKCLRMTLRFACPLSKRGQLEKEIIQRFWTEYTALEEALKES